MADGLLEAVRELWLGDPDLGVKPLLAQLREQQPGLGARTREVREALKALKAESEEATAAAPPAADAPPNVAISLACFGCARLPSDMGDDREKHSACEKCVKLKVPTTYWCGVNCPGNPGAWKRHAVYHTEVKGYRVVTEDGGVMQQQNREAAERQARIAARTGDEYMELLAKGMRCASKQDLRREAKAYREAIALKPDLPDAYYNLGAALLNSGHDVEAVQRYIEAMERYQVGSASWAAATAVVTALLKLTACEEVAKPEWWNDEGLKALSARVVRAAPNDGNANQMRADVLSGQSDSWQVGPRSAAELKGAATHYERAAAVHPAPAMKAELTRRADFCRSYADAM